MRKIISILVLALLSLPMALDAQNFNSEQRALRSDLFNFLREEGFLPEYDTDGEIKFKSEGKTYYIAVAENNENPMFVTLYRAFSKPENYSMETLVMASKNLNFYKGVKVLCYEESYKIQAELFVRSAEPMKAAFYKLKDIIDSAKDDVLSECQAVSSSSGSASIAEVPFLITKVEVANVDKDGRIIQDYGASIWDYKTQYLKPRITVKPYVSSGTYTVYVKMYKDGQLSTGSNSPAGYSYSTTVTISGRTAQVFALSGWGNSTSGNWSIGNYRFEIWYGDYCIGSKSFRVI